jgi:hypothetical protein
MRCSNEDTFNKHNETRKHKEIISGQKTLTEAVHTKNANIFVCDICDFKCCKESNYKKHLDTIKHKRLHDATIKTPINEPKIFSCVCGKKYKHHSSLAKHKRTCVAINTPADAPTDTPIFMEITEQPRAEDFMCSDDKITITKEMFITLVKNSEEMMKLIKEQHLVVPNQVINNNNNTTNNNIKNNNTFNLNIFLNEKCKDALNMTEFIDTLKITIEDLLFSKTNGISRGVTDVMIKGLKQLDIYKRPIHCTDAKRDIMYIKDADKWKKDDNHDMMKDTIVRIADKERTALQRWAKENPDWIETERKQIEYLTMMRSICEPIENYENYERKIVKNLGKEILVDK